MEPTALRSLNDHYREEFLRTLPALLNEMQDVLSRLTPGNEALVVVSDIFLKVHKIRGSSSTFGAQLIAAVCHPYEEILEQCTQSGELSSETLQLILNYQALLTNTVEDLRAGRESFDTTEASLVKLHRISFKSQYSIAIATSSRTLLSVCEEVGKSLNARVIGFEDSLNALQRALVEPFDVFIASGELYPLRGEALLQTLRMSLRHGHPLTTILVSADSNKTRHNKRQYDPDFILGRDSSFVARLHEVLGHLIQAREGKQA